MLTPHYAVSIVAQCLDDHTAQVEMLIAADMKRYTITIRPVTLVRQPNASTRFWFTISATRGRVTRKAPPLLDAQQPLRLSLDDAQMEIRLSEYHKEYYELAGAPE